MIETTQIYYFVFGVLAILGGIMGFAKKKSMASLVAGGISGVLLLVASSFLHTKLHAALILGLIVCVLLAGRFVPNYIKNKAIMPAGLMSLLSVAGIAITLLAW
ncbi:MAG: TMEM14 family protein [Methylacidiphilales bacterium]|nr:TMEM14 family protein [Candidatus Methylacidiphilales bacterium]